jgi:RNA polymerase primary sigma factor
VELLSREGEIAIAKRIEAGRDMMIGGLCESPLTFKAIVAWHDAVNNGRMLLRDVIDLEATAGANTPEGTPPPEEEYEEGDEAAEGVGLSLSALEEKLKPDALKAFEDIEAAYAKLHKLTSKRMDAYTSGGEQSARSEKTYEKQRQELVALVEKVHLHTNRIEELVDQLKGLNRRQTMLEGQVLRLAEAQKVRRDEFIETCLATGYPRLFRQISGRRPSTFIVRDGASTSGLRRRTDSIASSSAPSGLNWSACTRTGTPSRFAFSKSVRHIATVHAPSSQ